MSPVQPFVGAHALEERDGDAEADRPGRPKEDDMRDIYDGRPFAGVARAAWAQVARAFEVLVERQYFAPWNQAASRDCRDC
jgi:hypothetical protein